MRFIYIYLICIYFVFNTVAQVIAPTPAPSASNSNPIAATSNPAQPQPSNSIPVGGNPNNNQTIPAVNGTLPNANGTVPNANNNSTNNSLAGLPISASYGNSVFPGTATFLVPTASKSVSPLYRIDSRENVTFSWSFTNLLVRPANLTLAAVGPNKVTYTIGALAGDATSAVWHLSDIPAASPPLMMGMYQVQLYDQRGPTAAPQPGWLVPVTRLTIAFYSAEAYQPLTGSGYCPTCFYNAGKRIGESLGPMMMAFGVALVTSSFIIYGLLF